MKKVLLMTFVACFALLAASCHKDDDVNTEFKGLSGTTWTAQQTLNQIISTDMNVSMDMTVKCTLAFADNTKGTLTVVDSEVSYMMGSVLQEYPAKTHTYDFTYTFDNTKGTISTTIGGRALSIPFTYSKETNTIRFSLIQTMEEHNMSFTFDLTFTQK